LNQEEATVAIRSGSCRGGSSDQHLIKSRPSDLSKVDQRWGAIVGSEGQVNYRTSFGSVIHTGHRSSPINISTVGIGHTINEKFRLRKSGEGLNIVLVEAPQSSQAIDLQDR
jgi:hypothetical protein